MPIEGVAEELIGFPLVTTLVPAPFPRLLLEFRGGLEYAEEDTGKLLVTLLFHLVGDAILPCVAELFKFVVTRERDRAKVVDGITACHAFVGAKMVKHVP